LVGQAYGAKVMKKNVDKSIDILKLSDEIERDSQSGALSSHLLKQGHTLYEPDPKVTKRLRRLLPSGEIELGYWRNGEFVVTEINLERESDR
tara:strand:+ start:1308 stop:1583 length:276 start_codon:yes stop_codon:yes gene_type:complete